MKVMLYLDTSSKNHGKFVAEALKYYTDSDTQKKNSWRTEQGRPEREVHVGRDDRGLYVECSSWSEALEVVGLEGLKLRLVSLFDDAPWEAPLEHGEYEEGKTTAVVDAYTIHLPGPTGFWAKMWSHRITIEGPTLDIVRALYRSIMSGEAHPKNKWVTTPAQAI